MNGDFWDNAESWSDWDDIYDDYAKGFTPEGRAETIKRIIALLNETDASIVQRQRQTAQTRPSEGSNSS